MMAKELYFPRADTNGKDAVLEFAAMMDVLEKTHKCPVRMIRTQRIFGFYRILYEVIQTPKIKKRSVVDMLDDQFGRIIEIPKRNKK